MRPESTLSRIDGRRTPSPWQAVSRFPRGEPHTCEHCGLLALLVQVLLPIRHRSTERSKPSETPAAVKETSGGGPLGEMGESRNQTYRACRLLGMEYNSLSRGLRRTIRAYSVIHRELRRLSATELRVRQIRRSGDGKTRERYPPQTSIPVPSWLLQPRRYGSAEAGARRASGAGNHSRFLIYRTRKTTIRAAP